MIEQASLVIGEGNWAVKSDSLLGYKINNGKYYPREMSVVRATTGTRINEDGLVEVVPYNLLSYSEQIDNGYWSKYQSTITANATTAPDGTLTADRLNQTGSFSGNFFVTPSAFNGGLVSLSCFYKKGIGNVGWLEINRGAESCYIQFNLDTQVISASGYYVSTNIESVGNGWYRCSVVSNQSAGTANYVGFGNIGNNGDTIFAWGAQLVEGSSALDYLPTTDRLDVARIDYSSGSAALLVEPQRTNLALWSSSFNTAAWIKLNGSVTANATTSPDGTTNADSFIPNTTSGFHALRSNNFNQSSTTSHSWFLKANGYSKIAVRESDLPVGNYASFDLSTGTLISTSQSGIIENVGNGWYRCTLVDTNTGAGAQTSIFVLPDSYTTGDPLIAWSGDGIKGVFAYGAQVEVGSYPTSYIPTQGSTVTRNADVISKTGIADLIGQTEGTLFVEAVFGTGYDSNNMLMTLSDGGTNNIIYINRSNGGAEFYTAVSGATQAVYSGSILSAGIHKIAVAYKQNDFAMYVDGVQVFTDTSGNIPACNKLNIGSYANGGLPYNDDIKAAAIFKTRLTNAELATLTTI